MTWTWRTGSRGAGLLTTSTSGVPHRVGGARASRRVGDSARKRGIIKIQYRSLKTDTHNAAVFITSNPLRHEAKPSDAPSPAQLPPAARLPRRHARTTNCTASRSRNYAASPSTATTAPSFQTA